jgi:hypothetical protein
MYRATVYRQGTHAHREPTNGHTPYKMALRAGKFDVPERFINFNA